ncbi:hypothetical protein [Oleispirillum naphthae]|uniref:hypothetical protein n=1 Tax=Oleispirillum naphthae TaxID=2838853 RepID=UPI0030826954
MKSSKGTSSGGRFVSVTVGRSAFTSVSAVEGIRLSRDAQGRFAEFDRKGLSPAQRRAEIIKAHSLKTK